jgi:hypothetical protein
MAQAATIDPGQRDGERAAQSWGQKGVPHCDIAIHDTIPPDIGMTIPA